MPRYRFSWSNFPDELLDEFAQGLGLESDDAAASLRRTYGARPKPEFVRDAWPILLATWLAEDKESREWIVDELRVGGFGKQDMSVSTKQRQLDYLGTCRNARSLRETVLAAFLIAGEPALADTGAPTSTRRAGADTEPPARPPADTGPPEAEPDQLDVAPDLDTWVEHAVSRILERPIRRDADGDIPIHRGSSVVYVRARAADNDFLEIFSLLLTGFEMSPSVYEAVNTINMKVPLAKTVVNSDGTAIVMSAELYADNISVGALWTAIDIVTSAADHFDNLLQRRFGGMLAGEDDDADEMEI